MENRELGDKLKVVLDDDIVKEAMGSLNINTQELYQEYYNINEDEDLYYHDGRINEIINDESNDEDDEDLLFDAAQLALSLNRFLTSPRWSLAKSPTNIVSGAKHEKPEDGATAISTIPRLNEFANDWNNPQRSEIDDGGRESWTSNYHEGDISRSYANKARCHTMGTENRTPAVPYNSAVNSLFQPNLSIPLSYATNAIDDIVKQKPKIRICIEGAPELDFTKPEGMFFTSAQPSPLYGDETSLFNGSSAKKKDRKIRMKLDTNGFFNNHARTLVSRHKVTEKYDEHTSPRGDASYGATPTSTKDIPQSTESKKTIENISSHVRPAPSQPSVHIATTAARHHTDDTNMDVRVDYGQGGKASSSCDGEAGFVCAKKGSKLLRGIKKTRTILGI